MVARRVLALVTFALGCGGCGTSILASYPLDTPFLRASNDTVIAVRPAAAPLESARYTLASAPLRVVCQRERVVPRVLVTKQATLDGAQRFFLGLPILAEGAGSAALFADAAGSGRAGSWVGASLLAADALGALAYAILAPSRGRVRTEVGRGAVERSGACPPGVIVQTGAQHVPVQPDGSIPNAQVVAGVIVDLGASIQVGGRVSPWLTTPRQRCELALESHHPMASAVCATPPARQEPAAAPPPPRAGWPNVQWNGSVSFP